MVGRHSNTTTPFRQLTQWVLRRAGKMIAISCSSKVYSRMYMWGIIVSYFSLHAQSGDVTKSLEKINFHHEDPLVSCPSDWISNDSPGRV